MRFNLAIIAIAAALAAAPSLGAPTAERERVQVKETAPPICVFSVNGKQVASKDDADKPAEDKGKGGKRKPDAKPERVCDTRTPVQQPHG